MILHRFWADETRTLRSPSGAGVRFRFRVGSDESQADAEEKAATLFRTAENFLLRTDHTEEDVREFHVELRRLQGCGNEDGEYQKPICEEILEELNPRNVVTRNHYGAEVLNSTGTCFIDVDHVRWSFFDILRNLFGSYSTADMAMAMTAKIAAKPENADLGFRLYRTAAGFRVIVTGNDLEPGSARVRRLFRDFHADPRYARLCDLQRCFRARLTPKPSRLRVRRPVKLGKFPPFPHANESDRLEAKAWADDYNDRSDHYAVCRFIKSFGRPGEDSVIAFHDEKTRADEDLPLA